MKTLKYIILGVLLSSLVISSFSFSPSKNSLSQDEKITFCETYTQQELVSKLNSDAGFFSLVHLEGTNPESSRIGTCNESDMKALRTCVRSESFQNQVPNDLIIVAGAEASGQMVSLYAIREPASNDVFPSQQDLVEVSVSEDNEDNYTLLMSFSESGAKKWASLTLKNKGRDIAILFDGKVIAAPRVTEEIKGGKCSISGSYTEEEIYRLKAALLN